MQRSPPTCFCSSAAKGSPAERAHAPDILRRLTHTLDDEETGQPERRAAPQTPPKPSDVCDDQNDMGRRAEEEGSDAATVISQ